MGKTLATMQVEVFTNNHNKGWFDTDRTFGDDIALLHSELSEMLEAFREHGTTDATGGLTGDQTVAKPEGVGAEAADVLIRLLDTCHRYGIHLDAEYERKMAYNRTRPHRHGGKTL